MRLAPILLLASAAGLAGCQANAPFPNGSPFGTTISANRHPRGSEAYCRQYANQTAGNAYENQVDRSEDGFGVRFLTEKSAQRRGAEAYRRCLGR
ncbi:hypothetical protein [Aurantimonas sp. VKM B-3413]|uniref:hypothetical protein n=1 Tax=Aurantimonas sp. VKM B-3413 TaxID=2779401 RepID=UPI001E3403DD|nr:hypothetical protein [Aurantimonas sp. VKM B-3413]MCB8838680.1 hypothetical protein [Aurantimonas sp. VKM B-3413]